MDKHLPRRRAIASAVGLNPLAVGAGAAPAGAQTTDPRSATCLSLQGRTVSGYGAGYIIVGLAAGETLTFTVIPAVQATL